MGLYIAFAIFAFLASLFARTDYAVRCCGGKGFNGIVSTGVTSISMVIGSISSLTLMVALWVQPGHIFYYIGILTTLSVVNINGWLIESKSLLIKRKLELINLFLVICTSFVFVFLYHS